MNALHRLTKLLSRPRHQKKCGWLDKIAQKTDFITSKLMMSWQFTLLLICLTMVLVFVGTHFHIMNTVAQCVYPILGMMVGVCLFQFFHIERVSILSESHRKQLAIQLSDLKLRGTQEDQRLVLEIAQILRNDQFENYHAFWWNSVGLAMAARIEELNTACVAPMDVKVEIDVDTQLDDLHHPPPNKKLKV